MTDSVKGYIISLGLLGQAVKSDLGLVLTYKPGQCQTTRPLIFYVQFYIYIVCSNVLDICDPLP